MMDVYIEIHFLLSPNQLEFKCKMLPLNPWDNQSSIIAAVDQLDTYDGDISDRTDIVTVNNVDGIYYNIACYNNPLDCSTLLLIM